MHVAALLLALPLAVTAEAPPPSPDASGGSPHGAAVVHVAAQAGSPLPASPSAPRWSFGAGVALTTVFVGLLPASPTTSPSVVTSLERAIGERTWLVLGASGAFLRAQTDVDVPFVVTGQTRSVQAQLASGVRRVVTGAGAPVDVSLVGLVEGGRAEVEVEPMGAVARQEERTWFAGASAGIAVERALAPRLALRLATPIVGVRYARGETELGDVPLSTTTAVSAQVRLAPSLELRLAF